MLSDASTGSSRQVGCAVAGLRSSEANCLLPIRSTVLKQRLILQTAENGVNRLGGFYIGGKIRLHPLPRNPWPPVLAGPRPPALEDWCGAVSESNGRQPPFD